MTLTEQLAMLTTSAFFLLGVITSLLPIIPGGVIVWFGVLIHKIWLGDDSISWYLVAVTGMLTLLAQAADLYMGVWGARRFGASWRGVCGAIAGAIIGLFIPPPILWIIIGPFIGAIIGELSMGRNFREGSRAGFGTILGSLLAFSLKIAFSFLVIFLFYTSYFLT